MFKILMMACVILANGGDAKMLGVGIAPADFASHEECEAARKSESFAKFQATFAKAVTTKVTGAEVWQESRCVEVGTPS